VTNLLEYGFLTETLHNREEPEASLQAAVLSYKQLRGNEVPREEGKPTESTNERSVGYGQAPMMSHAMSFGSGMSDMEDHVEGLLLPDIMHQVSMRPSGAAASLSRAESDSNPLMLPDGWGMFDPKMDQNRNFGNDVVEPARKAHVDEKGRTANQRLFLQHYATRARGPEGRRLDFTMPTASSLNEENGPLEHRGPDLRAGNGSKHVSSIMRKFKL
jgi:hypothetical protein